MNRKLSVTARGPFETKASALSPVVEEVNPGLRIAVTDISGDNPTLTFRLLLSYGFLDDFFLSYKDIGSAITVVVQEVNLGASVVFPLVDPTINLLEPVTENYRPVHGVAVAFMRGWASVPVSVRVADAIPGKLVVWATLQGFVSNVLSVDGNREAS